MNALSVGVDGIRAEPGPGVAAIDAERGSAGADDVAVGEMEGHGGAGGGGGGEVPIEPPALGVAQVLAQVDRLFFLAIDDNVGAGVLRSGWRFAALAVAARRADTSTVARRDMATFRNAWQGWCGMASLPERDARGIAAHSGTAYHRGFAGRFRARLPPA